MKESRYHEPDGYIRMHIRDLVAGVLIVSLFALAAISSHIWQNIVRKTSSRIRTLLLRSARQDR